MKQGNKSFAKLSRYTARYKKSQSFVIETRAAPEDLDLFAKQLAAALKMPHQQPAMEDPVSC